MSWHRLPARTLRLGAGDADRRCHNLVRGNLAREGMVHRGNLCYPLQQRVRFCLVLRVGGRASSHIAAAEDKRKPIVFGGYRKEAHCFWWLQQGFGIYGCSGRALFRRTCVCVTALTVLGCLVLSCLVLS